MLEILGHLADVEINYGYRLRQMLADTKPVIALIDQDAWARNLNYFDSPPSQLVAFYGLGRHHNLRLLRNLKVSDLSKSAFHPEAPFMTGDVFLRAIMMAHESRSALCI